MLNNIIKESMRAWEVSENVIKHFDFELLMDAMEADSCENDEKDGKKRCPSSKAACSSLPREEQERCPMTCQIECYKKVVKVGYRSLDAIAGEMFGKMGLAAKMVP